MILIAHRGNLKGPNPDKENKPDYLEFAINKGYDVEIVEYLKTPLSISELKDLIQLLKINPMELVRKNESIWKENFMDQKMTDSQLIAVLIENPKLIQRPIIKSVTNAVIGRQMDNLIRFLKSH